MRASREEQWTLMHAAYRDGPYANEFVAEALAAACLVFRDATWAADLYPSCSHGQLGISTSHDYVASRQCRAVWLAGDESRHPIATFQDTVGSANGRTEHIVDLGEATLRSLAEWVRGRRDLDAG